MRGLRLLAASGLHPAVKSIAEQATETLAALRQQLASSTAMVEPLLQRAEAAEARVALLEQQERGFRELLWLRHGCTIAALYGDDGEMQCGQCLLDFKRDSFERVSERFTQLGQNALAKALLEQQIREA